MVISGLKYVAKKQAELPRKFRMMQTPNRYCVRPRKSRGWVLFVSGIAWHPGWFP